MQIFNQLYQDLLNRFKHADAKTTIAMLESDRSLLASEIRSGFTHELSRKNLPIDIFYTSHIAWGDQNEMHEIIDEVLDDNHKMIIVVGDEFAQLTRQKAALVKKVPPLLFASTTNLRTQTYLDSPGFNNFSGLVSQEDRHNERIEHVRNIFPQLKRVVVVYDPLQNSGNILKDYAYVHEEFEKHGIQVRPLYLSREDDTMSDLAQLIDGFQPQLLFTLYDFTAMSKMNLLIDVADAKKVPLFTSDGASAQMGAALSCGNDGLEMGMSLSYHAYQILIDEVPAHQLPIINYAKKYVLTSNVMALHNQCPQLDPAGREWLSRHAQVV